MAKTKLNVKEILSQYEEAKAKRGGGSFLRLDDGENVIRILPFQNEEKKYELYVEFNTHWINNVSYPCRQSIGEDCPICAFQEKLSAQGLKKVAKSLDVRTRYFVNAIKGENVGVLEIGPQILDGIMAFMADPEYGDVSDFETGRKLKITKSGSGFDTEYKVIASPKENPVDPSEVETVELHDFLEEQVPSEADMEEALEQNFDTSGVVEDPKPAKKPVKPEKKPVKVVAEEEEDVTVENDDGLDELDRTELKTFIRTNELDVTVFKSDDDDAIRIKIREKLALAAGEETEEDDDVMAAVERNMRGTSPGRLKSKEKTKKSVTEDF